jgi:hypothetical protein
MDFSTDGTRRMVISGTGNVGIGTASPSYKLVINDDASTGQGLHVTGGGGGGTIARFERDVGHTGSYVDINVNSGDPQIRFTESSGVDWAIGVEGNVFEIVDGSNLGGTSLFELSTSGMTVAGTGRFTSTVRFDGATENYDGAHNIYRTGAGYLRHRIADQSLYLGVTNTAGTLHYPIVLNAASDLLIFNNEEGEMARFNTVGDFGINVTSPAEKLHVAGNTRFDYTHGQYSRLGLPAANNGAGNGDAYMYLWMSEPSASWTGGGIARNMRNNSAAFSRINTALTSQMIRFEEAGNITFTVDTGSVRATPLNLTSTGATVTGNMAVTGTIVCNSTITVGNGLSASDIYMSDSDEGVRRIHCNSNRVGFLTQAGGWGSYCNDDGSWASDNRIYVGFDSGVTNSISCSDWFRSNNSTGWYNQSYAGGIYMQDTTWVRVYNNKAFYVGNHIAATGNITAYYSDERLKTKVSTIENALDKVVSLEGFVYVENEKAKELGYNNDKQQVGVSAQSVQRVLPEAVSLAPVDMETHETTGEITSKSGENYLTVDYARLVPLLIESIKELSTKNQELENRLKKLEDKD